MPRSRGNARRRSARARAPRRPSPPTRSGSPTPMLPPTAGPPLRSTLAHPRPGRLVPLCFERMFDDLNLEQRAAVLHGDGPLLIVAGAGTGKTSTLACRVAHLVERGVRPERILLLTFSRRAAREMLSRAERVTGLRDTGRVWGGTFHAVANRLLRLHGRPLGLRPDFTVLDP